MSTAEANELHIEHVGPIKSLSIKVPDEGGLVVLRGRNGSGKSTALQAVGSLVSREGKLPLRDGADKGRVEWEGVRITVGRRQQHSGELDVATLEGRFDLGELVDPGIADPTKADARRIKALLNISQGGADPAVFFEHVLPADELFQHTNLDRIIAGEDPITLADKLRRDLQEAARREEEATAAAQRNEDACLAALADVDLEMAEPAPDAVEHATARLARLTERKHLAIKQRERAQTAREKLAEATPPGLSVEDAQAALDRAMEEQGNAHQAKFEAIKRAEAADQAAKEALRAKQQAEQHAAFVTQCREAMQADLDPLPSDEELQDAENAIAAAKQAIADYGAVEAARKRKGQAATWRTQREAGQAKAERLRKAASNVDVALSVHVSRLGGPLFVRDGRLMTRYPGRGDVPFAELSDGERYRIALDVSIAALAELDGRDHRLLVLGQHAYEALDPANRLAIAERLRGSRVVVFTAEASDGPLVAATE